MDCEHNAPEGTQANGPAAAPAVQRISRILAATALALLGLWILRHFLAALAWATILTIALWPLYRRAERAFPPRGRRAALPLAATLLIGLGLIVPLAYAGMQVAHETGNLLHYVTELRNSGLPTPGWLARVPGIGAPLDQWWRDHLNDPQTIKALFGRVFTHIPAGSARAIGIEVVHRLVIFGFTLLTLFFLFRDGDALSRQLLRLSHRLLGPSGERVAHHMVAAVHGTVVGLVLVGLAEGVVIGCSYALAGLPHVVPLAALTGVLAIIPFGAPLIFWGAGFYLFSIGETGAAVGVVAFGLFVVFVADHFIRPFLIGGAARVPFLWVLLGLLGGIETFGLIGLFLGPVVMAALISLWREWTDPAVLDEPPPGTPRHRHRQ